MKTKKSVIVRKPIKSLEKKYLDGLEHAKRSGDQEVMHCEADEMLCDLLEELGYKKIVESFNNIPKWYA